MTSSSFGIGTKREHHSAVISRGCTPHSLWLYGIMKWREMPGAELLEAEIFEVLRRLLSTRDSLCARTKSMQALRSRRPAAARSRLPWNGKRVSTPLRKDARLALRPAPSRPGSSSATSCFMYGIAQVQPVAGLVEVEAARLVGARVPAEPRLLLDEEPRPAEVEGGRDAGETAAEDDHPRVRVRGSASSNALDSTIGGLSRKVTAEWGPSAPG